MRCCRGSGTRGSIQFVSRKFSVTVRFKFKGNSPAFEETAFTVNTANVFFKVNTAYVFFKVNTAYVFSIGNDLLMVQCQQSAIGLNPGLMLGVHYTTSK